MDECVDARLATEIAGHDVTTVPRMGWSGMKDGEILERADGMFDVLITTDQHIAFQQNLTKFDLALVILRAKTNRIADVKDLVPSLQAVLPHVERGEATYIDR